MQYKSLPNHIAIIMDGNSRWAKSKGLTSKSGHKQGAEMVKKIASHVIKLGIKYLTLYAFSAENWLRPRDEVSYLIELFKFYLRVEAHNINKQNIRLKIIGDKNSLSSDVIEIIDKVQNLTENNNLLNLNIAFNYGSRQEIVNATKEIATKVKSGELKIENIDEDIFNDYLYTSNIPDPDLLIRTSGEFRISNFLLWQSAYTEFYFTPTLWPDFCENNLNDAIEAYQGRNRRYGKR